MCSSDLGFAGCAIEASSIGIVEHRLTGTHIQVALFTNFTQDHLDYHGSMERYAEAKARLFRLPGLEHAVINVGDPVGADFARRLDAGVALTAVAVGGSAPQAPRFVHVTRVIPASGGLELEMTGHFGARRLRSRLIGGFKIGRAHV